MSKLPPLVPGDSNLTLGDLKAQGQKPEAPIEPTTTNDTRRPEAREADFFMMATGLPRQTLRERQDGFLLLTWLRAHHGSFSTIILAIGFEKQFGWTEMRLIKAKKLLLRLGYLKQVSAAGKGKAIRYQWKHPSKTKDETDSS